jgi:hypothetical protein
MHKLTYHAQVNISYHKLTLHRHVKLLIEKIRTSYIFWGYKWWHVKYVKLKQRSKLKTRRKGRKTTPLNELTVPSVHTLEHLVHCTMTGVNLIPSYELTAPFLVASDELEKRSRQDSSVGWTNGPLEGTIGLSGDPIRTRQRRGKTKP